MWFLFFLDIHVQEIYYVCPYGLEEEYDGWGRLRFKNMGSVSCIWWWWLYFEVFGTTVMGSTTNMRAESGNCS